MASVYYHPWFTEFKHPFGAVKTGQTVRFRIKVELQFVKSIYLKLLKEEGEIQQFEMVRVGDYYQTNIQIGDQKGLYFYAFEIHFEEYHQSQILFYGESEQGGEGQIYESHLELRMFQLTCYEMAEKTPEWYREGTFYQIFPDRFANGNEHKQILNPRKNTFIYATEEDDPLYIKDDQGEILRWDFFGGNIQGIIQKIPYLKELGITGIYLNPIFEAASNHRYDTANYHKIDPLLGTEEDFVELLAKLHENRIRLILDGVFSHVGQHSLYFNADSRYGKNIGAVQSEQSPYYPWFTFTDYPKEYKSWWGIKDLPEVNKEDPSFQNFIYGDQTSVLSTWNRYGVDGWRLDVADELPENFIQGIRKNLDSFTDKQRVLIGEVWEDASNKVSYNQRRQYILGNQLHGVMNYPLRTAILDLLQMNRTPKAIAADLMKLYENYPYEVINNNLNNIGTHDTERIYTLLKEDKKLLDLAFGLLILSPGVPCIYYGDEAGLVGGKDPENRRFFPWKKKDLQIYTSCQQWIQFRKKHINYLLGQTRYLYSESVFGLLRFNEEGYVLYIVNPTINEVKLSDSLHSLGEPVEWLEVAKKQLMNKRLAAKSYLCINS